MPVMITETSAKADLPGRARWMDETIAAAHALRAERIPVLGYTWFPLFTMVDWAYRTGQRPLKEYLIHLGLYDAAFDSQGVLRRHRTALVRQYRQYIASPMPRIGN
jgi:hypothetical protein